MPQSDHVKFVHVPPVMIGPFATTKIKVVIWAQGFAKPGNFPVLLTVSWFPIPLSLSEKRAGQKQVMSYLITSVPSQPVLAPPAGQPALALTFLI